MPGLETKVLVHHEAHLRRRRIGDDGLRLRKRRRQRLLADDVDAALRGLGAYRLMRRRRRDDVHEVRLLRVEHLAVVGVEPGVAELLRDLGGLHGIAIAERDDLDFGNPRPRLVLEVAEVAGADADASQARARAENGGVGRRFGDVHRIEGWPRVGEGPADRASKAREARQHG